MTQVIQFKYSQLSFEAYGNDLKQATISRLVGPAISSSMGAGIARFDHCSIKWTVRYDELIVTLEGLFKLVVGEQLFECGPGDVLWIPKGTELRYEGNKAVVFYILSPVDWQNNN